MSTYCVSGARLWGCSRLSTLCSRVAVVGRGMFRAKIQRQGRGSAKGHGACITGEGQRVTFS